MSNSLRGDTDLKTPGKTYTMRMSVNAIIKLEEHFEMGVNEIAEMLGDEKRMRMSNVRTVVFYSLQDHHPDITEDEAGEAITEAGFAEASDALNKALAAAFPSAALKTGAADNPRKPKQGGTGKAS